MCFEIFIKVHKTYTDLLLYSETMTKIELTSPEITRDNSIPSTGIILDFYN